MSIPMSGPPPEEALEQGEYCQFLTFRIEKEIFAVPIASVREVVDYEPVTRVPGGEYFLQGVINLRGAVIAVADIRLTFGMKPVQQSENTCIIVLELDMNPDEDPVGVGIIADQVLEVASVLHSDVQPHPELGTGVPSDFLRGLCKVDQQFFMVLDVCSILDSNRGT